MDLLHSFIMKTMSSAYPHTLSMHSPFIPIFNPAISLLLFTFLISGSMHSINSEHDSASPCLTDCSMFIFSVVKPFTNMLAFKFLLSSLNQFLHFGPNPYASNTAEQNIDWLSTHSTPSQSLEFFLCRNLNDQFLTFV